VIISLTISVYEIIREMKMMIDGFVPSGLVAQEGEVVAFLSRLLAC
jgi:hypothetical protein